jgi:hypothetical protein
MNRISRDMTAPRRPAGKRVPYPHPRPETGLVEESAELIRIAWEEPRRLGLF